MIQCPACRHQDYEGELFCSNCGARLWSMPGETLSMTPTLAFETSRLRDISKPLPLPANPIIKDLLPGQITLTVSGSGETITLEGKRDYILGREGQESDSPDVNLSPHGAREKGVSRKHASLRVDRRQLLLMDLGSSNGTWLNGSQLAPQEPSRLESGDEIRLGKLVLKVKFNL
jgi:pSer/pThr/pTyr-binding forkhead associated (FHA) protein